MKMRGLRCYRALVLLLSLLLLAGMLPAGVLAAGNDASGGNISWTLSSDGVLTVSGEGAMPNWSDGSETPWAAVRSSVQSVVVERGVTDVGSFAFAGCKNLTGVSFSDTVGYIGAYVFYDCSSLSYVFIPAGVYHIMPSAFVGSSLRTIEVAADNPCYLSQDGVLFTNPKYTLVCRPSKNPDSFYAVPEGVQVIQDNAFCGNTGLKSLSIPASVTEIRPGAFYQCTITDVYYAGTEAQWDKIRFGADGDIGLISRDYPFTEAVIHLGSKGPGGAPAGGPAVVLSSQNLSVDGTLIECEKYNIDGSNYFKLRDLAYVLNGTESQFAVGYDNATKTVTITSGQPYASVGGELSFNGMDKSATATPSKQAIIINGKTVSDLSVFNIGGNNFFKLRDLGAAVGFQVDYDKATNTAIVLSGKAVEPKLLVELTPEQIYAQCSPAVFYIEIYDETGWCTKTGSGFFIRSDGVAVTNYHVISGAASASITVSDTGAVYKVAGVYDYSVEEDWAVLQIEGSGFKTLEIGDPNYDVGGATVYAIGSPLGLQNTISAGIISNPARRDGAVVYIQTNAAISHGSSGGALLNKYGQVIGITSATYADGQNLNLAIPMTYLANMNLSAYTPLGAPVNAPSGILTLSDDNITLGLNTTYTVYVTAVEKNCSEDDDIYVRSVVADNAVVSCTWGDWNGDDTTLTITPLKTGSTEVTVYFLIIGANSETILDVKTISVTVTAGAPPKTDDTVFEVYPDTLSVALSERGEIHVHAHTSYLDDPNHEVFARYQIGDDTIVSCSWNGWEGDDITLFVDPKAVGTTEITILYILEDDTVLAQKTIPVTVYDDSGPYGVLKVSPEEVGMSVGDTVTIIVTGLTDTGIVFLRWNVYGDDILDVEWGSWHYDNVTADLFITALAPGEADVEISLYDESGEILLDCVSIPISVE